MKVGIVNFNSLNHKQLNNTYAQSHQNLVASRNLTSLQIKDSYSFSTPKTPNISFEGQRLPFSMIKDIPCPCCGKIMIPPHIFKSKLTEEALSGNSINATKLLSEFK